MYKCFYTDEQKIYFSLEQNKNRTCGMRFEHVRYKYIKCDAFIVKHKHNQNNQLHFLLTENKIFIDLLSEG